ncbi:MAG: hypothetical protein V3W10_00525 [candidate division NC10 bacterium]|jgi:hypothetical protein
MISHLVYKNIHLIGVFMVLMALGGLLLHRINGGTQQHAWRKPVAITHGVGMFLILLGGFGMLARLGIFLSWPGWVIVKVIIWIVLGALIAVIFRKPTLAKPLWWITIVLGGLAAYLAGNKPF